MLVIVVKNSLLTVIATINPVHVYMTIGADILIESTDLSNKAPNGNITPCNKQIVVLGEYWCITIDSFNTQGQLQKEKENNKE